MRYGRKPVRARKAWRKLESPFDLYEIRKEISLYQRQSLSKGQKLV